MGASGTTASVGMAEACEIVVIRGCGARMGHVSEWRWAGNKSRACKTPLRVERLMRVSCM